MKGRPPPVYVLQYMTYTKGCHLHLDISRPELVNGARDGFRGSRILAREALERLQSTLIPLFVLGNVQCTASIALTQTESDVSDHPLLVLYSCAQFDKLFSWKEFLWQLSLVKNGLLR